MRFIEMEIYEISHLNYVLQVEALQITEMVRRQRKS